VIKKDLAFFSIYFALLVSIWASPFLLLGKTTLPEDCLLQYYPWRQKIWGKQEGFTPCPVSVTGADPVFVTYPGDELYNREIKQGRISLWNPHIYCGIPTIGTTLGGAFWPGRIVLHRIFSTSTAHQLEICLVQFLSGLGMALFARSLNLTRVSAAVSGTAWAFGGYNLAWVEMGIAGEAACSLAFALWGLNQLQKSNHWSWIFVSGFSLGLLGLSGHPQLTALGWLTCFGFSLTCLAGSPNPLKHTRSYAAAALFGLMLSAPQALPTLDWVRQAHRIPLGIEETLNQNRLLPQHSVSIFFPEMWGRPSQGFQLVPIISAVETPEEFWIYCGFSVNLLALLGAVGRDRKVWYFNFLCLLCVSIATGSPVYTIAVKLLPSLGSLIPGRVVWLISLSISVLAGYGCEKWLTQSNLTKWKICISVLTSGLVTFIVSWCYSISTRTGWASSQVEAWTSNPNHVVAPNYTSQLWFYHYLQNSILEYYSVTGTFLLAGLLTASMSLVLLVFPTNKFRGPILLGFLFIDLLYTGNRVYSWNTPHLFQEPCPILNGFRKDPNHRIVGLASMHKPNSFSFYGTNSLEGYASLPPERLHNLLRESASSSQPIDPLCQILTKTAKTEKLSQVAACQWFVMDPIWGPRVLGNPTIADEQLLLYANEGALPRAFTIESYRSTTSAKEGSKLLFSESFDPHRQAIVEGTIETAAEHHSSRVEPCQYLELDPQKFRVKTEAKNKSLLVVANGYDPGWSCTIDEKDAKVFPANVAFLGVMVPAGEHTVEFNYRPRTLNFSLCCSALAISFGGGYLAISLARSRKNLRQNPLDPEREVSENS
jgi:hypothetical protein